MDLFERVKMDYFSYKGRLNRKPYILRYLIMLAFMALGRMMMTPSSSASLTNIVAAIILVACTISIAMLDIRRLHDLGRKWYWILVMFIPLVNFAFILYLAIAIGEPNENEYGPSLL